MARRTHHTAFINPDNHDVWPTMSKDAPVALVNDRGWHLSGRVETLSASGWTLRGFRKNNAYLARV